MKAYINRYVDGKKVKFELTKAEVTRIANVFKSECGREIMNNYVSMGEYFGLTKAQMKKYIADDEAMFDLMNDYEDWLMGNSGNAQIESMQYSIREYFSEHQ